ncbi:hypothetical protein GOP47_0017827 [Adiantum capillus-veneris]|uniref:Pectinesterase n=1 Tax=Adiantum capillus-veneris TaxID=13818 RepID=A0A9D4ZA24_ADICA|nr:hypothetical protein GOP47_0017827 [Adiantum capillus-veneris]
MGSSCTCLHALILLVFLNIAGLPFSHATKTTGGTTATLNLSSSSASELRKLSSLEDQRVEFLAWIRSVGERVSATSAASAEEISAWLLANKVGGTVLTVSKSGGAQFTSIQAAVNTIPKHNSQRVVIQIAAGVYHEKVFVPKNKPYVTFLGAGKDLTKITWGDTKASTPSGKTQDSATVGVNSEGFIARGITFENSAPAPPPGAVGRQAVAFKIAGDKGALYNCNFLGAQDTLYDDHGRHYFENCYIQGSIDFIFGDGQSLYKGCQLRTLSINPGSLTAQKRASPSSRTGFSFVDCRVDGSGVLYLGRAWGAYSRVVFSYTYLGNVIIPKGWYNWGVSGREKTVYYGQYKCSGPGANQNGRVAWAHELSDAEAAPFQSLNFIDGASWLQS